MKIFSLRRMQWLWLGGCIASLVAGGAVTASAQQAQGEKKVFIPRTQTKPPGPPLSPKEALSKMEVPEGFRVELVAAEPDVVNPVAMTFDERGRIWVTESFEYPRREPGPGRDRIKILEDTNGDGQIDSVKIFAEGLNIPSGIAVGYGGVWVANSPDILFLEDTDGDDRADKTTVVVTGFGRDDTHELPNSLTWGPDGALYGLNGVFNPSRVTSGGRKFEFTCAMFRIDPRTREFDLFCEGTSNPWGIAFDPQGSAFVSACVIDHLWHLTETGYYHRQGGPYPPHTWKIGSIVEHKHHMAAYCGITYMDTAAYPEKFRDVLVMGNIHGSGVNVDKLQRRGSTYLGTGEPDLLKANDVWFMPVVQKIGPDGCLYVLDWYDRYHCYQDASADPEGVDRGHGRLYRLVYDKRPAVEHQDLGQLSSPQLVGLLGSPNIWQRETAQRLLAERRCAGVVPELEKLASAAGTPDKHRMHALWTLISGQALTADFAQQLLEHSHPTVRAWAVRGAAKLHPQSRSLAEKVSAMAADEALDVKLQVAIAARKMEHVDRLPVWVNVLASSGGDTLIPRIVWQNLHPELPAAADRLLELVEDVDLEQAPGLAELLTHVAEKVQ
jgi:putative membrane-bound dehydrogenase-like protein